MPSSDLPKPDYATSNMRLVGHSDQGGRCDGVQIMVHRGYAYIGHIFSKGFTVVDVRDPSNPKVVKYVAAPPNTWTLHLQAFDDLLLVIHNKDMFAQPELADEKNYYKGSVDHHAKQESSGQNWSAGMAVYDISKPDDPKQIGFMPVAGTGLHRLWYVGGRWAYASALLDGFSDYILITIDMQDPKRPVLAGKYWLPGMNVAAGEKANWPTKNGRFGLHHAIIKDDIAYCSWRDACLAVVDVKDKANPKLITHKVWAPPFGGGTHNALPLKDRRRRDRARSSGGRLQANLGFRQSGQIQPDQHLDLPGAFGQELSEGRGPFRATQRPREPAGQLRQLRDDICHISKRRPARLRHQGSVPADGGGRLCAAAAGQMGRSSPEPTGRVALGRRIRRQERALLRHRLQRRALHRGIQGLSWTFRAGGPTT